MTRPKIINKRQADTGHQVVTVQGGGSGYCTKPCPGCPWRRENAGSFPAQAFRISAETSKDMADHTFACHEAGVDRPKTCAGFLLSTGAEHNFSVRMAQIHGRLDLADIDAADADLFKDYKSMAVANGVDPDDPVLEGLR